MGCSLPPCSRLIPIMRLWSTAAAAGAPVIKRRQDPPSGMELGLDQQFGESWRLKAARLLDATYRTNVCDDASCNGNRIPGSRAIWLRLLWLSAGARLVRRERYSLYERYHGQ